MIRRMFSGKRSTPCGCCGEPARWSAGTFNPTGPAIYRPACERLARKLERLNGQVFLRIL